jgi:hypothetical protein
LRLAFVIAFQIVCRVVENRQISDRGEFDRVDFEAAYGNLLATRPRLDQHQRDPWQTCNIMSTIH